MAVVLHLRGLLFWVITRRRWRRELLSMLDLRLQLPRMFMAPQQCIIHIITTIIITMECQLICTSLKDFPIIGTVRKNDYTHILSLSQNNGGFWFYRMKRIYFILIGCLCIVCWGWLDDGLMENFSSWFHGWRNHWARNYLNNHFCAILCFRYFIFNIIFLFLRFIFVDYYDIYYFNDMSDEMMECYGRGSDFQGIFFWLQG